MKLSMKVMFNGKKRAADVTVDEATGRFEVVFKMRQFGDWTDKQRLALVAESLADVAQQLNKQS